jgi:hypothetical protein
VSGSSILTQFLIARIDDQVRIFALEFAPSEVSQTVSNFLVISLIALALKLWPQIPSLIALTFRSIPLDVHLGERRHQGLLAALVALEDLGGKSSVAILRDSQFELSYPPNQTARIVSAAVA